nr:MAG TPA: hypothetical protein [Caudoviricetes sp.]
MSLCWRNKRRQLLNSIPNMKNRQTVHGLSSMQKQIQNRLMEQ